MTIWVAGPELMNYVHDQVAYRSNTGGICQSSGVFLLYFTFETLDEQFDFPLY